MGDPRLLRGCESLLALRCARPSRARGRERAHAQARGRGGGHSRPCSGTSIADARAGDEEARSRVQSLGGPAALRNLVAAIAVETAMTAEITHVALRPPRGSAVLVFANNVANDESSSHDIGSRWRMRVIGEHAPTGGGRRAARTCQSGLAMLGLGPRGRQASRSWSLSHRLAPAQAGGSDYLISTSSQKPIQ